MIVLVAGYQVRCILWVHMMTSSNGNIFRVTDHLCGEFGEFPAQRPVTRSFGAFFDMRLNKRLSKQSWGWWFERLSHHYDVTLMPVAIFNEGIGIVCGLKFGALNIFRKNKRSMFDVTNISKNNCQRCDNKWLWACSLVCDLNRTPNCYGKTWRFLCPFFKNLHLRECPPLPTLCKISLPIYVIVTNKLLQPLTTTWYDSLVLSFSLLKI